MAEPGDTIDPNDLDSIDALLDEAELEAVADPQGPTAEETDAPDEVSDDLLDDLEADLSEPEPEPEPEPAAAEPEVPPPAPAPKPEETPPAAAEQDAENFLQKRAAMRETAKPNNAGAGDINALKKLVIIFSSVTIGLVVLTLVFALWGALSSGGGLDEETMSLIEDIQAGTNQTMLKVDDFAKSSNSVEKKLDALSFQIEQINGDLGALESLASSGQLPAAAPAAPAKKMAEASVIPDLAAQVTDQPKPAVVAVAPVTPEVVVASDSKLAKKLDKVSSQVLTTQRRIAEVNRRLKSLQKQYKTVLRSVKNIEKDMAAEQLALKKKQDAKKARRAAMYDPNTPVELNEYDQPIIGTSGYGVNPNDPGYRSPASSSLRSNGAGDGPDSADGFQGGSPYEGGNDPSPYQYIAPGAAYPGER